MFLKESTIFFQAATAKTVSTLCIFPPLPQSTEWQLVSFFFCVYNVTTNSTNSKESSSHFTGQVESICLLNHKKGKALGYLPFVHTNHRSYTVQLQFLIMEIVWRSNQHQMQLTGNDRFQRFIFLSYPIQHQTFAFILLAKKGKEKKNT